MFPQSTQLPIFMSENYFPLQTFNSVQSETMNTRIKASPEQKVQAEFEQRLAQLENDNQQLQLKLLQIEKAMQDQQIQQANPKQKRNDMMDLQNSLNQLGAKFESPFGNGPLLNNDLFGSLSSGQVGNMKTNPKEEKSDRYWNDQEHNKYLTLLSKYGLNAAQSISDEIKTKDVRQVRSHQQKYLQKLQKMMQDAQIKSRQFIQSNKQLFDMIITNYTNQTLQQLNQMLNIDGSIINLIQQQRIIKPDRYIKYQQYVDFIYYCQMNHIQVKDSLPRVDSQTNIKLMKLKVPFTQTSDSIVINSQDFILQALLTISLNIQYLDQILQLQAFYFEYSQLNEQIEVIYNINLSQLPQEVMKALIFALIVIQGMM
ncbi:Myb-like_DNA-binding domain-containing protein [Hexamita inflata]|uniref:Myb-like DNA-binding domain-containing protein n=1 Tax=Hexamita inflata TaxID=28002 RepID=A0AA86TRA5_9EUKA|nr:Myb-like DNA-binding domain-containing protein [Hexamita inflata]